MDSKNPSGAKGRAEVYDWIQCIIFALVFCVLLFVFAVRMVNVVGHSMVPTLEQNDKVVISNLFYHPKPVSYTHLDVYKRQVLGRYQAIQFMPDPAVVIIIRIISDSESDERIRVLRIYNNHPMEYDDTLVRQIIECVVVESKEKIKVVYIGGTEIEMTL